MTENDPVPTRQTLPEQTLATQEKEDQLIVYWRIHGEFKSETFPIKQVKSIHKKLNADNFNPSDVDLMTAIAVKYGCIPNEKEMARRFQQEITAAIASETLIVCIKKGSIALHKQKLIIATLIDAYYRRYVKEIHLTKKELSLWQNKRWLAGASTGIGIFVLGILGKDIIPDIIHGHHHLADDGTYMIEGTAGLGALTSGIVIWHRLLKRKNFLEKPALENKIATVFQTAERLAKEHTNISGDLAEKDLKDLRKQIEIVVKHITTLCKALENLTLFDWMTDTDAKFNQIHQTINQEIITFRKEMKKEITEVKQDMTTIKQEMVTKEMFDQHTTNMKQETKEMFDQHTTNMKQEMVTKQEINEMLKIHTDNIVTHLFSLQSSAFQSSQQGVLKKDGISANKPLQRLEEDLRDCFARFNFKCHITTDKELHIQCTNWLEMTQPISNSEDTLANNVELIKINLCKAFNLQRNSISFDEHTVTLIISGKSENLELCLKTLGQMFPHSSTLSPQNNTQTFFSRSNSSCNSPTDEKNEDEKNERENKQQTCFIM